MSAVPSVGNSNALIAPMFDKISLSHLLDAAVQKTYHELYTMADVYVHLSKSIQPLYFNELLFLYLVCIVNPI